MASTTQRQKDQNRMMKDWMIIEKMQNCKCRITILDVFICLINPECKVVLFSSFDIRNANQIVSK